MTQKTANSSGRIRLDQLLVESGLFESRSRARDAVLRSTVKIDGRLTDRPGMQVSRMAQIAVDDPARGYVSRAALKLIAALEHFKLDPSGMDCLDLGASTGGFSQVLLERGANHVAAVDVGHGQLHDLLRNDARVTALEGLNARGLTLADLGGVAPQFIVCDASFISLRLVLEPALQFAAPDARGVFLVKPQFEAGREAIGKGGILRKPGSGLQITGELSDWLDRLPGWRSLGFRPAPIEGGDGNLEYLLAGVRR